MLRWFLGAIVILALVIGAGFLLLEPIVEGAVRRGLEDAGYEEVDIQLGRLSLTGLTVNEIRASATDKSHKATVKGARATYDLSTLWREQSVNVVTLDDVVIDIVVDDTAFSSAQRTGDSSQGEVINLPFDEASIDNLTLSLKTPGGDFSGRGGGYFSKQDGGSVNLSGNGKIATGPSLSASAVELSLRLDLSPDGTTSLAGSVAGDIVASDVAIKGARIGFDGTLPSWRDTLQGGPVGRNGAVELVFASGAIEAGIERLKEVDGAPSLAPSLAALPDDVLLDMSGALLIEIMGERVDVRPLADRPLVLANDDLRLAFHAGEKPAFYSAGPSNRQLDFNMTATGASSVEIRLALEEGVNTNNPSAGKALTVSAEVIGLETEEISLSEARLVFAGERSGEAIAGRVTGKVDLPGLAVGRASVKDAVFSTSSTLTADISRQTLALGGETTDCAVIDRGRFAIAEQGISARVREGRLCATSDAPLLDIAANGAQKLIRSSGVLTMRDGALAMSETTIKGAAPRVSYNAVYEPTRHASSIKGEVRGGALTVNDFFRLSNATGNFDGALVGEELTGMFSLAGARLDQEGKAPLISPMSVSGSAEVQGKDVKLTGDLTTIDGVALGAATGVHNLESNAGSLKFETPSLRFDPGGLQPTAFSPLFVGQISDATGFAEADVAFAWNKSGVTSSGDFSLLNLSFVGPGLAVSKTVGVNGDISLSNLMPLASKGRQVMTIDLIDLDALQLENGAIEFELPGDESLGIFEASFPWYGGSIGAYNTEVQMSGDGAATDLRVDGVDLATLLSDIAYEGLSGEGTLSGTLPLRLKDGRASIVGGILKADEPGILRYAGAAGAATAQANQGAAIVVDVWRELKFSTLTATLDGPLDGDMTIGLLFEGSSLVAFDDPRIRDKVETPIVYNVNIKAPLLSLLDPAKVSADIFQQIERAQQAPAQ